VAFDGGGEVPSPANELVKDPATVTGRASSPVSSTAPGTATGLRPGGKGLKRDAWARELEFGDFHDTDCIVRDRNSYPWHDQGFVEPAPADLFVYQFHVGVFSARGIRPALTLAVLCHRPL
jgi:1,4-alpha-glucan branching enzyme